MTPLPSPNIQMARSEKFYLIITCIMQETLIEAATKDALWDCKNLGLCRNIIFYS